MRNYVKGVANVHMCKTQLPVSIGQVVIKSFEKGTVLKLLETFGRDYFHFLSASFQDKKSQRLSKAMTGSWKKNHGSSP